MTVTRPIRADHRLALRHDHGFTLIELMVVILVMGILAAIATPIFLGAMDQSRAAAVQAELVTARLELVSQLVDDGELVSTPVQEVVIDTWGDPNVTLRLWATETEFCVVGEYDGLSESWAASRRSPPIEGAGCAANALIVLP